MKYHNTKIKTTDGTFDSKREYARFKELQLLERAGKIDNLQRQVSYELIPTQKGERGVKYIADFVYTENGEQVVEDVKSPITAKDKAFIIKRKLLLWRYGIKLRMTY